MNNIVKEIHLLFEKDLYSNVIRLCDLTLSSWEQKPDFSPLQKFQITNYYADSLYAMEQYQQAESYYKQCVQLRKNVTKSNKNGKLDKGYQMTSEADLKYRIHLCLLSLKKKKAALEVLQSIGAKQKDAKINMALGGLLKECGMNRLAVIAYKEVLSECPFALEAVEHLLELGISGADVNSLTVEAVHEIDWLSTWLKAQAQMHSRDFKNAVETLKQLDVPGMLKDNVYLLITIGNCYNYLCEDKKAIEVLQRAHRLDPNMTFGSDLLSKLLAESEDESHVEYLECLIPKTEMSVWPPEHWVVFANYMYSIKHFEKALYFSHQAMVIYGKHTVEPLLSKAYSFFKLGRYQEAATCCTEALQVCNYRFDIYKCLVDCYLKMNRLREAESMAVNACKQLNNSSHALKLHATVLLKDASGNGKAIKRILEKAITQDKESSTNAVILLVMFLEEETQFDQAVQLLLKQIENNPTSRLYQLLGDCYVNTSKDIEAFDAYNSALRLDPFNQRAAEGLNLIGPSAAYKKRESQPSSGEPSYLTQNTPTSKPDTDPESDLDPWPLTNEGVSEY